MNPEYMVFHSGGMLSGKMIVDEARAGRIELGPDIDDRFAGPNSYDLRIGNTYGVYELSEKYGVLDVKKENKLIMREIDPDDGLDIFPGQLYIVPIMHPVGSDHYVPLITGRSSMGRLGLSVHQEAGFGDLGFHGIWNLQISSIIPVTIYPYMRMAQVYFFTLVGDIAKLYNGKYQNSGPGQGSKSYKDF